jgi:uncharacterized protein (TIGR00730 family)
MTENAKPDYGYEINKIEKEESWRLFRIMGEFVEGFDALSGIEPAVSIYGSARHLTRRNLLYRQTEEMTYRLGKLGFNIITGGGPGLMEAANRGGARAGVDSVGLNIKLLHEQEANHYATMTLTFNHFFVRKVMLVKYATAFIIMPGGLGTLDELTEVLTLIQTQTIKPFPVLMYNRRYWEGFIDWLKKTCLNQGFIDEEDLKLVRVCDTIDEVVEGVKEWYEKHTMAEGQPVKKPQSKTSGRS